MYTSIRERCFRYEQSQIGITIPGSRDPDMFLLRDVSQIPNPVLQSRDPEIFVLCLSYSCFNDSNFLIIYLLYNNTTWNQYSIYNGNLQIHYSGNTYNS